MIVLITLFSFLFIQVQSCTEGIVETRTNIIQCQNCSYVSNNADCQKCQANYYYSNQQRTCLVYCKDGRIEQYQTLCVGQSTTCIDGFQWSNQSQLCEQQVCNIGPFDTNLNLYQCQSCSLVSDIKFCSNGCSRSQYFSQLLLSCFEYCKGGIIARNQQECQSSTTCVDGYLWNSQFNYCEKVNCSVKIGLADTFNGQLYQCPNCSYVSDASLCSNTCQSQQKLIYYYQQENKCMVYCGNGLIAQNEISCQNTQNCIDGFSFINQGVCNLSNQNQNNVENIQSNQKTDVISLIIYIMISLVGILIVIILVVCFFGFKKFKKYFESTQENTQTIQEIRNQNQQTIETLRNEMKAQQLEILSLNQKIKTFEQAEVDINGNIYETGQGQDLQEEALSYQTIQVLMNDDKQLQLISQQNFKQTPILNYQTSQ